jgi:sulfatase modifying factor 1
MGLLGLAVVLATGAPPRTLDPGPNPACPPDMRLVEGVHHEHVSHVCLDELPTAPVAMGKRKRKDLHCYHYEEDVTVLEGPTTPIRVCMDQFEAPNRRGARPLVMASFRSAESWCGKVGKRVCNEREWELACEGPAHLPLTYGWAVNTKLCNSNKGWRPVDFSKFGGPLEVAEREAQKLWQGAPSGHYTSCVSAFGVHDLNGNVEEWVTSREGRAFPGSLMGGFWAKPWTGCRGTNDAHEATFAFYETGFRCCKTPSDTDATKPVSSSDAKP